MNLKDIEKLIKLVEESDLSKLSIEEDGVKVELIKKSPESVMMHQPAVVHNIPVSAPENVTTQSTVEQKSKPQESDVDVFASPMVGTFYDKPSPEAAPFVNVGDKISKGQPLCIIEAMKLFNEIEAEYSGTIVEIMVKPQDSVEFGQPLFKIKKDA
jgi:acetyl-CoA carboxylase biotin carboxyl carrier protein